MNRKYILSRIGLALLILIILSGILILSDYKNKQSGAARKIPLIALIQYSESTITDDTKEGFLDFFKSIKMVEGRDYNLKIYNAQGDIPTLNTIMDAVVNTKYDCIVLSSTPTLQAAIRKIKKQKIVFTTVADPVFSGAGESDSFHLPNFTGIKTLLAYREFLGYFQKIMPRAKKIGTLFTQGESNSVHNKDLFMELARELGYEFFAIPINSSTDVVDAAEVLCSKRPDAIAQIVDNTTDGSFKTISDAAAKAGIPIFGFVSSQVDKGAVFVLARDFYQAGCDAGGLAWQIINGADPAKIPFRFVSKTNLVINLNNAEKYGIYIPDEIIRQAYEVIGIKGGKRTKN